MTHQPSHRCKQCLFVLLSLADLGLTWWLLNRSGGKAYEANPLARWFLDQHGWLGMAAFKASIVLLVLGLVLAIARSRPRVAGRVLALGCAALAVIVLYSASLCRTVAHAQDFEQAIVQRKELLDERVRKNQRHTTLRIQVVEALVAQRCTLGEAIREIENSELTQDPAWSSVLSLHGEGLSHQQRLGAYLIFHTVMKVLQSPQVWEIAFRLEREFEERFDSPAPQRHREILRLAETTAGETHDQPVN